MQLPALAKPLVQTVSFGGSQQLSVLRLDAVHPAVTGNKWYKLRLYLAEAQNQGRRTIVSFGGAYSNHLLALAAACRELGLRSMGVVRGEKPAVLSPTLTDAEELGMQLFFTPRTEYASGHLPAALTNSVHERDLFLVAEGGYGERGARGAATLLDDVDFENYSHIVAACGTGTTLAGLVLRAGTRQSIVGIPVLKGGEGLVPAINALLPADKQNAFTLLPHFHQGGYAKKTPALLQFMNEWFLRTGIPSDFVYTGKLFFAVDALLQQGFFPEGARVLVVHSGGLQGNRSLPAGTLIF